VVTVFPEVLAEVDATTLATRTAGTTAVPCQGVFGSGGGRGGARRQVVVAFGAPASGWISRRDFDPGERCVVM
jgi:hypothetical protein